MRSFLTLLVLYCHSFTGFGQETFTISGVVTDESSGEALIGAFISESHQQASTVTNNYGFFSLTLEATDSLLLVVSHLGFRPQVKQLHLQENLELSIKLVPGKIDLEELVIYGNIEGGGIEETRIGVVDVPLKNIREVPSLLGEADVLKLIQLMPGVQGGNEGTAGFYVRGGNADQNLVQLDEAIVYNPNHLLGVVSTFNPSMLKNATLIKGGFPAQYGGRLSSILDLTMREGNNQDFHASGGIGIVSANLTVEGPLRRDVGSFIVSGRRTYLDALITPFLPKGNESRYNFHDFNAKINWKLNGKNRLYLSYYHGQDRAKLKSGDGINYTIMFGNTTGTFRWNHIFGPKLFVNTSVIYNKYDQDVSAIQDNFFSQTITRLEDINGKTEFQYFPNPNHSVRFGAHYTRHHFLSGGKSEAESGLNQNINRQGIPAKDLDEYAFYVNDEIVISPKFSANVGVRMPGLLSREVNYMYLEPRASLKVGIGAQSSIKASLTQMNQFLHQIPSSTASIPTDIWIPSTARTKPQRATQVALGYFQRFKSDIDFSVEGYYKDMDNLVLFPEGNQLIENFSVDTALVYGKGWSYGTEIFVRKNKGPLTGWISYTLSWSWRQFDDLNFGNKFPFRYDRRHVLNVVGNYQLNDRWKLSGAFIFNSGIAYTLPEGRFPSVLGPSLFEGNYFIFENRNNQRLGAYHRLDFSAIREKKGTLWGRPFISEWVFGVYNLYSRQNPYFVYLKVDPVTDQPEAIQVTLLPIIPSISYNFKF